MIMAGECSQNVKREADGGGTSLLSGNAGSSGSFRVIQDSLFRRYLLLLFLFFLFWPVSTAHGAVVTKVLVVVRMENIVEHLNIYQILKR